MSRRGLTFGLAGLLLVVLVVLATVLPVPYVILVPGPVTDTLGAVPGSTQGTTTPVVSVSGAKTYSTGGHIYLTTVGVVPASCDDHPSLLQAIRAWFHKSDAVQPMQVTCPPGESSDEVQKGNENDMAQSQRDAITAALLQLGYAATSRKLTVTEVSSDVPAAKVLRDGDAVVAIDGHPINGLAPLRAQLATHKPGDPVTLTIERGTERKDVTVKTVAAPGTDRAIIGFTPDLQATFKDVHVKIGIDPADVGGPSAGLAFTLGIVDRLTPGELTDGKTVAVTGTIDGFGNVGPIGGIQQKIAGADRAGATVFLAPASECDDARAAAPSSMTLVKVTTLKGALDALAAINNGSSSFPHC
jgi:PDZ domain-containing protein